MAAEFGHETGIRRSNSIERIANVEPRNRARRAFELGLGIIGIREREGDDRSVAALFDP